MKLFPRLLATVCLTAWCSMGVADTHALIDQPIVAKGPLGALQGSMLEAKSASAPIVLIIPGSGPTDRDGNNPLGIRASTYKLLAQQLATLGVTTVRIDKRGMFGSKNAVNDPNQVTIEEYASDVHAWVEAIRERKDAKCVWLLGHSEGGLVALAAAQDPADICGLILVATPGIRLGQVLLDQFKDSGLSAAAIAQASKAVKDLEAGRRVNVNALDPVLQPMFPDAIQGFLSSVFRLKPTEMISRYTGRTLILQGDRDIQVKQEDANALHRASKSSTLVVLPDINHVLKHVPDDSRAANLATYVKPNLPIPESVGKTIAAFVNNPAFQSDVMPSDRSDAK